MRRSDVSTDLLASQKNIPHFGDLNQYMKVLYFLNPFLDSLYSIASVEQLILKIYVSFKQHLKIQNCFPYKKRKFLRFFVSRNNTNSYTYKRKKNVLLQNSYWFLKISDKESKIIFVLLRFHYNLHPYKRVLKLKFVLLILGKFKNIMKLRCKVLYCQMRFVKDENVEEI